MKEKDYILLRFGRRLRDERQKRNLSQERLGQLARMHRTYIGMLERGEKNVSLLYMERLAEALNISLRELIDF